MRISLKIFSSQKWIASLFFLYFGKVSGIVVNFIFLPLYSSILGPEQFGLVATILSLQALLMMLDIGLSTMVTHKISGNKSSNTQVIQYLRNAENSLLIVYVIILTIALLIKSAHGLHSIDWQEIIISIPLLYFLVIQNVFYSALISKNEIKKATLIQVFWNIFRATITLFTLYKIQTSFIAFLYSQLIVCCLHFLFTRKIFFKMLDAQWFERNLCFKQKIRDAYNLILTGRFLLLSGIAGAIAMQLDKPIISLYISPASLSPYFLASIISATPLSILATPIAQYFQPKIIHNTTNKELTKLRENLIFFTASIVCISIIPALILYTFNLEIIGLWLHHSPITKTVSTYSKILIVGFSISALSYVPYVVLVANSRFNCIAKISLIATILLIGGVLFFSINKNIEAICYAFVAYFLFCTIAFSFKARNLFKL